MTADPVPSGREVIERVTTATGEWQLQRREGHFEVICNGIFLMASYNQSSNRQLATLALGGVRGEGLRVLIGGLGIGYTAQAALEDPRVRRLEIVEIEPAVVAWHRAHFSGLCGRPLADPRTVLVEGDLNDVPLSPGSYDAILLDTDNGPGWLARPDNRRLYTPAGVERIIQSLTPQGIVGYWSAHQAEEFSASLRLPERVVREIEVPEAITPDRRGNAWVYLVQRAEGPASRLSGS